MGYFVAGFFATLTVLVVVDTVCLLYTSDAADE